MIISNTKTIHEVRPNTKLEPSMLMPAVVLCCGEDEKELLFAMQECGLVSPIKKLEFRSYRVWKFSDLSVILAPIGTGSLEPLMSEVFSFNIVNKIILIGTAGQTNSSRTVIGKVYRIDEAYLCGTALDREITSYPLVPNLIHTDNYETATIVSTDLYYGLSESENLTKYQSHFPNLNEDFRKRSKHIDLVDMEVGQFYALCRIMPEQDNVQYTAFKGPANALSNMSEQTTYSLSVLKRGLELALKSLQIAINDKPTSCDTNNFINYDSSKITEELKLYWTIQIGVVSILGFLATALEKSPSFTSFIGSLSVFMLMTIGAIYNIVGNYYIRLEAIRLGIVAGQENVITPHLAQLYLFFGAVIGLYFGDLGVTLFVNEFSWSISPTVHIASSVGGSIICVFYMYQIQRKVFCNLFESAPPEYKTYSEPLRKLFSRRFIS